MKKILGTGYVSLVLGLSVALFGCEPNLPTPQDSQTGVHTSVSAPKPQQSQAPSLAREQLARETLAAPSKTSLSPHAAELAETVQRSQARLAASTPSICPKLIEFKVGSTTSYRVDEVMKSSSCKYFLYPREGEMISARVSNSDMQVSLVQPKYFNFANGAYGVTHAGKHVIEITYDGYQSPTMPKPHYDLSVTRN